MGIIALNNIQLFGYHGLHPEEKKNGNAFEIDVEVEYPFEETVIHDKMESSLDYGILFECVRKTIEGPSRNLIETLILEMESNILESVLEVSKLSIRLRKLNPPVNGPVHSSEVRLSWPR